MTFRTTVGLAIACSVALGAGALEPGQKVPRFALEDQFGDTVLFTFPREKPVFLSVADRTGAEFVGAWREVIEAKYGEDLEFRRIAWMWEVPSAARGTVMTLLKTQYGPVLIDWEGKTAQRYGAQKEEGWVFIVGHDGLLAARVTGPVTDEKRDALFAKIDAAIEAAKDAEPGDAAPQD